MPCPTKGVREMPYLRLEDTEIYYEVHGDGPPFLFCSVTGLDHQAWKFHQVPEFSRDHKVIVFDYRDRQVEQDRAEILDQNVHG